MTLRHALSTVVVGGFVAGICVPSVALAQEIPSALQGWREWAVHGQEHRSCPFFMAGGFGERSQHLCAWPQRLRLDASADGGRFFVTWTAYVETWLPLPGDATRWPLEVSVDGAPAPVVERAGGPAVRVAGGRHRVEGRLAWERRPESLPVPEIIALVDLTLDGEPVFPLQRSGASLWLGRPETLAGRSDALSVLVYRKLSDGLPPLMETRLSLDVSGQGREMVLGPVLPSGFAPTAVSSELPVLLQGEGRLRVQLRPGNWQVVIGARGLGPLERVVAELPEDDWADEEIWSYAAAPRIRVTTPSGSVAVDPSQVDVPSRWAQLPAFVMGDGAELIIEQRSRGMAEDANRLDLRRNLWLDFSGAGMTARDTINGRMVRDFRLDMSAPFELRRALAAGQPLLVTQGSESGLTGVELRDPAVSLSASSRLETVSGALPVTGWRSSFDAVSIVLHLPPGRELVAALGADSSPQAWIDRWSLLDVFLLLITTMLTGRLLGRSGGALALAFLVLSYHESTGPLWWLLVLLVLALMRRALPEGRLATVVGAGCVLSALVLALVVLPFVAHQLRLALYPQIEEWAVGAWSSGARVSGLSDDEAMLQTMEEMAPGDQVMDQNVAQEQEVLDKVVARSRVKAPTAKRLQRYAMSNVFQAGGGEPSWEWRRASLAWSGPVEPDQTVRLVVLPTWLTRVLRVAMVGLLAALLWRLVVQLRGDLRPLGVPAPAAVLACAALILPATVRAQETPDPVLLEQLRQRLLRAPECVPSCAHLEETVVEIRRDRLVVSLTVHAEVLVAAPVPSSESAWHVTDVRVDGVARPAVLRQEGGLLWVPLERGVHHIELRGMLASVDSAELRFPVRPARVIVRSSGWDPSGVSDGRLLTDTLSLVRVRDAGEGPGLEGSALKVKPFVRVERELDLDLEWAVSTRVRRLAPRDGSLTIEVPLLVGESVLTPGFEVGEGVVTVALSAGVDELTWSSRLERVDRLDLHAEDLLERSETWRVLVSPQWSAQFDGVPATYPPSADDYWVHEFHPLPGETLTITVNRPAAVSGQTLAVDSAEMTTRVGRRASEHRLSLNLRSTRGGQHTMVLPGDAEVLEVSLDGTAINVRPDEGRLSIPVRPGEQRLLVRWRDGAGSTMWAGTPKVDLGASASNLSLELTLPAHRWTLATWGPRVGPAVLYWGELLVMALVAFLLARFGPATLRFRHWLLLGLGFSTFSWAALVVVVVWLVALEVRTRVGEGMSWWRFDLVQLGLFGLTVAALICLLVAIPFGLLGSPDMHVVGNGSSAHALRWFADQSDGPLPRASALTLPLFFYRLAMLAWALWLASAVVGWLRWGWQCMTVGGGWRRRERIAAPSQEVEEGGGEQTPPGRG